ncbi:uncharacterized protein V6R79_023382 [Siganus canaliculatus]
MSRLLLNEDQHRAQSKQRTLNTLTVSSVSIIDQLPPLESLLYSHVLRRWHNIMRRTNGQWDERQKVKAVRAWFTVDVFSVVSQSFKWEDLRIPSMVFVLLQPSERDVMQKDEKQALHSRDEQVCSKNSFSLSGHGENALRYASQGFLLVSCDFVGEEGASFMKRSLQVTARCEHVLSERMALTQHVQRFVPDKVTQMLCHDKQVAGNHSEKRQRRCSALKVSAVIRLTNANGG